MIGIVIRLNTRGSIIGMNKKKIVIESDDVSFEEFFNWSFPSSYCYPSYQQLTLFKWHINLIDFFSVPRSFFVKKHIENDFDSFAHKRYSSQSRFI